MSSGLKLSVLVSGALIVSGCGSTVTVSDGYTYYGGGTRDATLLNDPQKTRVVVEARTEESETNFTGWRYSRVGSAVASTARKSYVKRYGGLPCPVITVAPERFAAPDDKPDHRGWYGGQKEYWRAEVCDATYEVAIDGYRNIAGQQLFEPGNAALISKQRPQARKTAPASPVSPATPVAQKPAKQAALAPALDQKDDPRLQLLPYELRRIVAAMPKDEQELYFRQYMK